MSPEKDPQPPFSLNQGADLLQGELCLLGPQRLMKRFYELYSSETLFYDFAEIGYMVTPASAGLNDELSAAFLDGSVLGLGVALPCLSVAEKTEMKCFLPTFQAINRQHEQNGQAGVAIDYLTSTADKAYARLPAYHPIIASLTDRLCSTEVEQNFFKRGFGLVMLISELSIKTTHTREFRREAEGFTDADMEQLIERLTEGQ